MLYDGRYYRSEKGFFPLRWTAPEAAAAGVFTSQSDVWSYGCVLLELYSNGDRPYDDVMSADLLVLLEGGHRARRPRACPPQVFAVMRLCWDPDPAKVCAVLPPPPLAPRPKWRGEGLTQCDEFRFRVAMRRLAP